MGDVRKWVAAGLVVTGLGLTGSGAWAAASKAIFSGKGDCRDIALTYDVEFSNTTQDLIDTIDALGIRTTWFLLGDSVDSYPELVAQVAKHHAIGNHTLNHPEMPKLDVDEMHRQIHQAEINIKAYTGENPPPFWRPPYGEYDDTVLEVAGEEGYPYTMLWSIDTEDWNGPSVETIRERIVDGAFPGAISLQHGFPPNSIEATRLAVGDLRAKGYQFVTIPEIMGFGRDQRDFGGDQYVVQDGDTPAFIGNCDNVNGPRIMAYNEISRLQAGAVLKVPHKTEVIIRVDGVRQALAVYPRIVGDRAVAHVRLAEQLGATVAWDGSKVIVTKGSARIEILPGHRTALVNGNPVDMGADAFIESDRVLVPVRFVAEELGRNVTWDGATYTINLK